MRKILFITVFALFSILGLKAQTSYKAAVGLGIDHYDEATFFGGTGKYFFSDNHVGQADFGINENATIATILYSFHHEFIWARGVGWYAGLGPSMIFNNDFDNVYALRPHAGIDFKVDWIPLVINIDWRPALVLSEVGENTIVAFGFGLQFAIN